MKTKTRLLLLLLCLVVTSVSAQRTNIDKGLIAHYLFNNTANDASSNGNDGIEFGGLEYVKDRFGNDCGALHFNGTNAYVVVPNSASLASPRNEFSVSVWFRIEPDASGLQWLTIVCKSANPRETPLDPQFRAQSTRVTVSINTDFTENVRKEFEYYKWSHYTLVYDGNSVKSYLNGQKYFDFPYRKPLIQNNKAMEIGRDVPGELEFFNGTYDDLRIYNRGLTEAEIQKIYKDDSERNSPKPCQSTQLPPEVEIITPSNNPHKTEKSDQKITATIKYVDSRKDVTFIVNGQKTTKFDFNPKTQEFSADISLYEGQNTVKIIGKNTVGKDDDSRLIIYKIDEPETLPPPIVTIITPSDNPHETTVSTQRITATIKNVSSKNEVTFMINGESEKFTFNPKTKKFETTVRLIEGGNVFEITGKNTVGEDSDSGTIIYKKKDEPQLPPPIVTIITPSDNPHETEVSTQRITATIKNVSSKKDVTFTINGQSESFTFNPRTEKFETTVRLIEGGNVFEITGKNTVGKDSDSGTIIYKKKKEQLPPPIVKIIIPSSNPYETTRSLQKISAKIKYVYSEKDVTFLFNGKSETFKFNPTTEIFEATVDLTKGGNTFEITGRNTVGKDIGTGVIIYKVNKPQLPPPTVDITTPNTSPYRTEKNRERISARIKKVYKKSDVTFTVNGKEQTNFSFNATSESFSANIDLIEGANMVKITGKNTVGEADDATVLIYKPKEVVKNPPTVDITSPNISPATTFQATKEIIATTTNVASKSDIDFTVNGRQVTDFRFDVNGQLIRANIDLMIGANSVLIKVKNKDGKDSDNTVVIRREKKPTGADSLTVTYKQVVTVKSDRIVFTCYDHQREDGDIVSVWLDDELIVDKLKLKVIGNGEFKTELKLEEGRVYTIIPKAWNLGTKPPNTMAIEIDDGVTRAVQIILESEIGKSEAIKIVYRK